MTHRVIDGGLYDRSRRARRISIAPARLHFDDVTDSFRIARATELGVTLSHDDSSKLIDSSLLCGARQDESGIGCIVLF